MANLFSDLNDLVVHRNHQGTLEILRHIVAGLALLDKLGAGDGLALNMEGAGDGAVLGLGVGVPHNGKHLVAQVILGNLGKISTRGVKGDIGDGLIVAVMGNRQPQAHGDALGILGHIHRIRNGASGNSAFVLGDIRIASLGGIGKGNIRTTKTRKSGKCGTGKNRTTGHGMGNESHGRHPFKRRIDLCLVVTRANRFPLQIRKHLARQCESKAQRRKALPHSS